jgi:hypothetical protein
MIEQEKDGPGRCAQYLEGTLLVSIAAELIIILPLVLIDNLSLPWTY